ncbi:MAG TPA: sigma-70 family RNA polymerase sigma factor [Anaerolineales bacterium]|nr:sigma-70 family RNA polymerase sigma factor [Anaerolineales bacterium]HMX74227.1 sigma-70 family RNA polymerase sigma factor [Anaerolineales bacterium]HNA55322.1 sigma-70 family RNA polymerase sigma factor [Anaerolineales bacterium]HNE68358.1 sigma-70 family RNA polymerase sigma factor [Anaerolineales bacterium]HNF35036.1 sigma-70 family RNA polymerase sigma factor [Anaerolineales bacterium]
MVVNFHELYKKYAQDVHRFAYWLCGNEQEAEDITSETFIRALTAAENIRAETVKGYLLTIARNLALKKLKQAKRITDLTTNLPAAFEGLDRTVETRLSLQGVMQFLQSLPEVDRAALLMHIQEDLPYEEIARALGISVASARVKVHRMRIKLNEYRMKTEESAP